MWIWGHRGCLQSWDPLAQHRPGLTLLSPGLGTPLESEGSQGTLGSGVVAG